MSRPPLLATILLRLLLPPKWRESIVGDLEEAWDERPDRLRYWTDAIRSIADCWRYRLRRDDGDEGRVRGDRAMTSLMQDVRYGARMMRRHPGFTAAAVLTLALGIGANAAMFPLLNILSLKPLPYRDPSRVVFLLGLDADSGDLRFSLQVADYFDIQRDAQSFERVATYTYVSANITGGDIPERVQAYRVTADTFELLGIPPALGRTLGPDDATPGRENVAIISDGLWKRRFGADPGIVGRKVLLNGAPHEVVGVMPPRFEFPIFNFKGDVWVPWVLDPVATAANRLQGGSSTVIARLRPGVSEAQADSELKTIMRRLAAAYPESNGRLTARVIQMGRLDDEQAGAGMLMVMATVALVLLLACANVANLLLARGISRTRELAVRTAVGATRWRIARQLVVESLLLALTGAVGGILLAKLAVDSLKAVLPEVILTTVPNISELGVDGMTLTFTLLLAVAAAVIFGALPAWRAARPRLQEGLKEGAAAGGTIGTRRLRATLVVAEVALATVLIIGAGLLARSYAELRKINPGFSADGVLTMAMTLPSDRYPDGVRRRQFYEAVQARIEQLPGVTSAGFVNVLPFSTYDHRGAVVIDGAPAPERGREPRTAFRVVTPRYLETLRIPLLSGRTFDARDGDKGEPVIIVNAEFVRRYMSGGEPLGRRVRIASDPAARWMTVVGTIGNVHHSEITEAHGPEMYVPYAQASAPTMMLAVRTDGNPEDHVAAVRGRILDVDSLQPVYHVKPMARLLADALLPRSSSAAMMATFSLLALALAVIGVYGVVSYGVYQQMPEFGVRLALGATPGGLTRLVVFRATLLVAVGVGLGLAGAVAVSGMLRTLLYGITPLDPLTFGSAAVTLLGVGMAACLLPAWRAASADALSALRSE